MASQLNPTRLQDHYDKKMGYKDEEGNLTRAGVGNLAVNITLFALSVISIVAVAGALPSPAMGWCTLGIGGGVILMQLSGGQFKKRLFDLISTAVFAGAIMTIGALGGAGFLTGSVVGYSMIGIVSAHLLFFGLIVRGMVVKNELNTEQTSQEVV